MQFTSVADPKKRKEAELIAIPFWEQKNRPKAASPLGEFSQVVKPPIASGDFSGQEGEVSLIYFNGTKENRALLVGLGKEEKLSIESLRRVYSKVAQACLQKGLTKLNILLPNIVQLRRISVEECLSGIAEGLLLKNYRWSQKTDSEEKPLIRSVLLIGVLPQLLHVTRRCTDIAEGVYLARDLINANADKVTPQYLAETAHKMGQKFKGIRTTVFDKKRIEKEKMGLLLAVGRGSSHDPAFIISRYAGNARSKDHTVIVGKGVTFDTGGLNLKPTGSMESMREDMSGAAAALGSVAAAAALGLKTNVTAVIPTAENAIDGKSFKPGDVYTSHIGKTVEVGNTDAEGRLILADALSYAVEHLAPSRIIDFATLTGSMVVALGEGMAGLFCNDDKLATDLVESGVVTEELLWRMPLHPPYKELLKSHIADLKNIGGRPAGAITAALFLQEFVNGVPWAHIDIAGTAASAKERDYWPKGAVGFGVRLILNFLQKNCT